MPLTEAESIALFRREELGLQIRFVICRSGDTVEIRVWKGSSKNKISWKICRNIPEVQGPEREAAIVQAAQTAWRYWTTEF